MKKIIFLFAFITVTNFVTAQIHDGTNITDIKLIDKIDIQIVEQPLQQPMLTMEWRDTEMHLLKYYQPGLKEIRFLSAYFPDNSDTGYMVSDLLPLLYRISVTKQTFQRIMDAAKPILSIFFNYLNKYYET